MTSRDSTSRYQKLLAGQVRPWVVLCRHEDAYNYAELVTARRSHVPLSYRLVCRGVVPCHERDAVRPCTATCMHSQLQWCALQGTSLAGLHATSPTLCCIWLQVVESCLLSTLPEHLNAEIMLGTIKDVSQAIAWIRSTFLFTRVRANPQHYG